MAEVGNSGICIGREQFLPSEFAQKMRRQLRRPAPDDDGGEFASAVGVNALEEMCKSMRAMVAQHGAPDDA